MLGVWNRVLGRAEKSLSMPDETQPVNTPPLCEFSSQDQNNESSHNISPEVQSVEKEKRRKKRKKSSHKSGSSVTSKSDSDCSSTYTTDSQLSDFLETMNDGIPAFVASLDGSIREIIFKVHSDKIAWGSYSSKKQVYFPLSEISVVMPGSYENCNVPLAPKHMNCSFIVCLKSELGPVVFVTETAGERDALVEGIELVLDYFKHSEFYK